MKFSIKDFFSKYDEIHRFLCSDVTKKFSEIFKTPFLRTVLNGCFCIEAIDTKS